MRVAYEPLQGFSASPEEHYKGGVNDTGFSSNDVRLGYMNGPKEGEKGASFGVEKVIFKGFTVEMTPLKKHTQANFEDNNKTFAVSCNCRSYIEKGSRNRFGISNDFGK